jgi:hypothetical protein
MFLYHIDPVFFVKGTVQPGLNLLLKYLLAIRPALHILNDFLESPESGIGVCRDLIRTKTADCLKFLTSFFLFSLASYFFLIRSQLNLLQLINFSVNLRIWT